MSERKLPDGWQYAQLKGVAEIIAGQSPTSDTYRDESIGLPFFQGKADFGKKHPTPRKWCVAPLKVAYPGDILISVRAPVGPTNVAVEKCCIGRGLAAIRPNEKIDRDFLLMALQAYKNDLERLGNGSTFSAIKVSVLESLRIPLPSLPEQQRIIAIFNKQMASIEQARAAAEVQLAAVEELTVAYLREVFESEKAQGWPKVPLGDLVTEDITNGAFKRRHEFGRGVPFVNVSDLFGALTVDFTAVERVEASPSELRRYSLHPGDLLFCRSSIKREGIGHVCLVKETLEQSIFDCHIMRVRVNIDEVLPEYVVYYWLQPSVRNSVIANAKTATMTTMNQGDLASVEIVVAPLDKQKQIVSQLQKQQVVLQAALTKFREQKNLIEQLPNSLLRAAFNGEL